MNFSNNKNGKFFLSQNGKQVGPYTVIEIMKKLDSVDYQWTDYVFDPLANEWVLLLEHPLFASEFNHNIKKTPIESVGLLQAPENLELMMMLKDKEWFILKDAHNYGPFSKVEIIQMLQVKTLFEYDYVWNQTMPAWKRISETADFSTQEIRKLKEVNSSEINEIFFRRRHARVNYGCSIVVHDNKRVYNGKSLEISAGGAGIVLNSNLFSPGDTIYLHFQPGNGVPPFNAVCNIVSKNVLKDQVKYGIKFVHLVHEIKESIKNLAAKPSTLKAA